MPSGIYPRTEETKKKMSRRMMGNKITLGCRLSDETKHKISERQKGRIKTEKEREKIRKSKLGDKSHFWKGKNADYNALHYRVRRQKGNPKKCEVCGVSDKNKIYDWANLTDRYDDPNDYKRMCRSCHRKYDYDRKELIVVPHG